MGKNLLKSKSIPISVWTIRNMCTAVYFLVLLAVSHGKCEYTESKINNNSRVELKQSRSQPRFAMKHWKIEWRKKNYALSLKKLKNALLCPPSEKINERKYIFKRRKKKATTRKELYESSIKQNVEKPIDILTTTNKTGFHAIALLDQAHSIMPNAHQH